MRRCQPQNSLAAREGDPVVVLNSGAAAAIAYLDR
jgi:hypothetical protein